MSEVFNPIELLNQLSGERSSGLLSVTQGGISWDIVVGSGELQYASCTSQSLEQLHYQLRQLGNVEAANATKSLTPTEIQSWDMDTKDLVADPGLVHYHSLILG
jgi:hypothetical protein